MDDMKETKMISIRLDKELIEKVKGIAKKEKISVSNILRHFIIRGVEAMERQP
jgi:predicted DNA-binding protein